jgi:hypothetical protein
MHLQPVEREFVKQLYSRDVYFADLIECFIYLSGIYVFTRVTWIFNFGSTPDSRRSRTSTAPRFHVMVGRSFHIDVHFNRDVPHFNVRAPEQFIKEWIATWGLPGSGGSNHRVYRLTKSFLSPLCRLIRLRAFY